LSLVVVVLLLLLLWVSLLFLSCIIALSNASSVTHRLSLLLACHTITRRFPRPLLLPCVRV
jgi:hypothetical protein